MLKTVILIGPPGSGKSSTGRALASLLGWSFVDTDRLIEQGAEMSVPEIFSSQGEAHFRKLERLLLESMVADAASGRLDGLVVGTGGGLPVAPGNFELLAEIGAVVCLEAPVDELVARLSGGEGRPLLKAHPDAPEAGKEQQLTKRLTELLAERAEHYKRAQYSVDTTGIDADQVAAQIVRLLDLVDRIA